MIEKNLSIFEYIHNLGLDINTIRLFLEHRTIKSLNNQNINTFRAHIVLNELSVNIYKNNPYYIDISYLLHGITSPELDKSLLNFEYNELFKIINTKYPLVKVSLSKDVYNLRDQITSNISKYFAIKNNNNDCPIYVYLCMKIFDNNVGNANQIDIKNISRLCTDILGYDGVIIFNTFSNANKASECVEYINTHCIDKSLDYMKEFYKISPYGQNNKSSPDNLDNLRLEE